MKLLALICLFCGCVLTTVAAQKKSKKNNQCSFSNELLFGQVETIEQHCYKAIEKGGKLLKGSRTPERYPASTFIESYGNSVANYDRQYRLINLRFYDEMGRLTRQDLHQPDPNVFSNFFIEANPPSRAAVRTKHEYNEKSEPSAKYLYDENDKPLISRFYYYTKTTVFIEFYSEKAPYNLKRRVLRDMKGQDLYKVYFDNEGGRLDSIVYTYKGKKQRVETTYAPNNTKKSVMTEKYKKGRIVYKANDEAGNFYSEYTYTKKAGNLIRDCKMYNSKKEMYNQQIIIYNPAGKTLSFKSLNDKGFITSSDSCEYDKFNNLTTKRLESKSEKNFKMFNRYEYDEQGNWIMKIVYFDDKPVYYIERKIKYFQ